MKLVKIKDVRPGQVWINKKEMITIDSFYNDTEIQISAYNLSGKEIEFDLDEYEGMIDTDAVKQGYNLIGKLGITHRVEDGKLVEITREYFQVDDVVTLADGSKWVLLHKQKFRERCFDGICLEEVQCAGIFIDKSTKIGTIGVTHEIVNDCEGEQ